MTLYFGFIEGISDIDTPYFASQGEQESFFEDKETQSIETSFYPPHYTNRIIVDTEDINLNTNINYCWFEYKRKMYYYFIDDIEYISEDTLALNITLDVIQTFYFNIFVSSAFIEREHINRWVRSSEISPWRLNRNYIRENISSNEFDVINKTEYVDCDNNRLWFCIKLYDSGAAINKYTSVVYTDEINEEGIAVPYAYLVLPTNIDKIRYQNAGGTWYDQQVDYQYIINILTDNAVLDFYILKRNPYFDRMSIITEGGLNILNIGRGTIYKYLFCLPPSDDEITIDGVIYSRFNVYSRFVTYHDAAGTFPIIRNTSISNLINSEYETALIDENYYRLSFGDATAECVFPTHYIVRDSYVPYIRYDFDAGANNYWIGALDVGNYVTNTFNNTAVSQVKLSMQLMNDAYKTYDANNRNRWLVAGIKATTNAISAFSIAGGGYSYSSGFESTRINSILNKRTGQVSERITSKNVGSGRMYSPAEGKTASDLLGSLTPLLSQGLTDLNYALSPSALRNTGNAITDLISLFKYTYKSIYKVRDYEQCGMYYQRYGYKVNRFVSNIENIFDEVKHRFYYNILKLSDANIHLHDVIEDESTISLIKERFENGIRLWNLSPTKVTRQSYSDILHGSQTITLCNVRSTLKPPSVTIISPTSNISITNIREAGIRPNREWVCDVYYTQYTPVTLVLDVTTIPTYPDDPNGYKIGKYEYDNVETDFIE